MKACNITFGRWHICTLGATVLLAIGSLIIVIGGISDPLYSNTYYVDNTLGNDNWSGLVLDGDFIPTGCVIDNDSSACADGPWQTLHKISTSSFQTDDSIYLKRGEIWNQSLWLHNKADGITLGAYGIESDPKPEIVANGAYAISLRDSSNWTIQDLKLRGGTGVSQLYVFAQTEGMQNIRLINLEIDGTNLGDAGFRTGIMFSRNTSSEFHIDNIEIAYCNIYNAGAPADTGNYDGINLWPVRSAAHIHHNMITDSRGDGIDVTGGLNHIIEYNTILRTTTYNGIKVHAQKYGLENIVVRYNLIVEPRNYGLTISNSLNGTFTNNSICKNSLTWAGSLLHNHEEFIATTFTGNIIKNNIFTGGNNDHGALKILNIADIHLTNDITNNLYKSRDGMNVVVFDYTMGPITYDEFEQLWLPNHAGSFAADPLFNNADGGDYTLAAESPAINSGLPVGATIDLLGNPVGLLPDMGACEHLFPDNDGDGHTKEYDCNDADPSIYPGAPEVKLDGIDQDCNGYDLTIEITAAKMKGKILYVTATSSLGATANLQLEDYGQMVWRENKGYWQFASKVDLPPDTITVSGTEGSESAPVFTR